MLTANLLKIGEISKKTGVSVGTLRYYESLRLLQPAERGESSYRYYHPDTVEQVQFIKQAQALGFSLDDIRSILEVRNHGQMPCDLVQTLLQQKIAHLDSQIQQMIAFKEELEEYRDRWSKMSDSKMASHLSEDQVCPLIATVSLDTNSKPNQSLER